MIPIASFNLILSLSMCEYLSTSFLFRLSMRLNSWSIFFPFSVLFSRDLREASLFLSLCILYFRSTSFSPSYNCGSKVVRNSLRGRPRPRALPLDDGLMVLALLLPAGLFM